MSTNNEHASNSDRYDAPPAPEQGQLFMDNTGGIWKVTRVTFAQTPVGFYLVHLSFGAHPNEMQESMILGPREFAALVRDRNLQQHLHSV